MPTSVTKVNNTFIRKKTLPLDSMVENRCEESVADDLNKINNTGHNVTHRDLMAPVSR
jgi:hypothetical protein